MPNPTRNYLRDGRYRPVLALWATRSGNVLGFRLVHESEAIPELDAHEADGVRRPSRPADYRTARVVARALAERLEGLSERGRIGAPATDRVAVEVDGETHEVELTVPHPDATQADIDLSFGFPIEELVAS